MSSNKKTFWQSSLFAFALTSFFSFQTASATVTLEPLPFTLPTGVTDNSSNYACGDTALTLGGDAYDACAGFFLMRNSSSSTETAIVDAVTQGDNWSYLGKWDTKTETFDDEGAADLSAITIEVTGAPNANSGSFTLSWTGLTEDLTVDLAFGMKTKNDIEVGYFFFGDETLTATNGSSTGSYTFDFQWGLSHEGLWIRLPDSPPPPQDVPLPGTLLLLTVPLLGLAAWRRRGN